MNDLISRQAAIDTLSFCKEMLNRALDNMDLVGTEREKFSWGLGLIESNIYDIEELPSAQQWHVIKKSPMTNDERIEWSEMIGYDVEDEDAFIYLNLPDDGEEVFVSSQYGYVYVDTFCRDEGCYFEGTGDMDGIVAWMPLPEPYKGEET